MGPLAGIPAIICGHVARNAIKNGGGRLTGARMAMTGLIFGYVQLVAILVGLLLLVFGAFSLSKMAGRFPTTPETGTLRGQQGDYVASNAPAGNLTDKDRERLAPSAVAVRQLARHSTTSLSTSEKGPWKLFRAPTTPSGSVCCLFDSARHCVWFDQGSALAKLDLATWQTKVVIDGKDQGGISPRCLALEGDHLWIGGHGAGGGGLWMYDIPSDSAIVYRVDSTREGDRKGLHSDWIWRMTAEPDQIWIYNSSSIDSWGITRFAYREREHSRRWTTWSVKNTRGGATLAERVLRAAEQRQPRRGGLSSDRISGLVPQGDGTYFVFTTGESEDGYTYHSFDPRTSTFTEHRLFPFPSYGERVASAMVTTVAPNGATGKLCQGQNNQMYTFLALHEGEIWFDAGLAGDRKWGNAFGFGGMVRFNPSTKSYVLYNQASTESRPGAVDGLQSDVRKVCFDGDDIWVLTCYWKEKSIITTPSINRYRRQQNAFTHYTSENADFPDLQEVRHMTCTPDAVFFSTDYGLLCYSKSRDWPKAVRSDPASGAQDAFVEKELLVEFDLPLNPRTISSDSVELKVNGALTSGTVSYAKDRGAILFGIKNRLPRGMDCELICKSLVQAENGNPISWTRIRFTPQ
jgi:hypothetical protein